jgi:uncharacterized membrane protein
MREGETVPSETTERPMGTGRIETFVDGVVAILITIMVLELKLPAEAFSLGRASAVLAELGPKLAVYALSFLMIAIMLLNHHMLMRPASRETNALYWWNANLLFWMSLIPLSTAALGDAPREPLAVAFYGAVLTANAVSFTLLHRCAACLAHEDGHLDGFHRATIKKDWFFTSLYASSIPLAFVSVYLSMAIFLINPTAYFFPEFVPWPRSWQTPEGGPKRPRRQGGT